MNIIELQKEEGVCIGCSGEFLSKDREECDKCLKKKIWQKKHSRLNLLTGGNEDEVKLDRYDKLRLGAI